MDSSNFTSNIEREISRIYLDYKNQIEYINDLDSANQLMALEYRKVNNYIESVVEEIKLDLYQEISKVYGIELAEKFNEYNFKKIEMKECELRSSDIYEEVLTNNETTRLKNDNYKKTSNSKNDNNVNTVLVSSLTLAGGVIGATISNYINYSKLVGAMVGGIAGLGLGILFSGENSNNTNKSVNSAKSKNNSSSKYEKKLRFSPKKMINIINKREAEAKKIIKENILQVNSKYDEICRGV